MQSEETKVLTKEEMAKVKKKEIIGKIFKAMRVTMSMLVVCMIAATFVYAASPGRNSELDSITGNIGQLKQLAENVIIGVGTIVAVIGGGMFGLAFAQDNIDAQSKGIKTLVAGGIMAAVGIIVKVVVPNA